MHLVISQYYSLRSVSNYFNLIKIFYVIDLLIDLILLKYQK